MWCLIFWLYGTHLTKYYYLLPNTCDFYARLFENAEFYTHMRTHRLPVSTIVLSRPDWPSNTSVSGYRRSHEWQGCSQVYISQVSKEPTASLRTISPNGLSAVYVIHTHTHRRNLNSSSVMQHFSFSSLLRLQSSCRYRIVIQVIWGLRKQLASPKLKMYENNKSKMLVLNLKLMHLIIKVHIKSQCLKTFQYFKTSSSKMNFKEPET